MPKVLLATVASSPSSMAISLLSFRRIIQSFAAVMSTMPVSLSIQGGVAPAAPPPKSTSFMPASVAELVWSTTWSMMAFLPAGTV